MFLMSTKALSFLFFWLTVLNLPVFMFYYNSNPITIESPTIRDYFSHYSLGNVGQTENTCGAINLANDR